MAALPRWRTPRTAMYGLAAIALIFNVCAIRYTLGGNSVPPKTTTPLQPLPPLPPVLRPHNPAWFGIRHGR